jgi:hypothetical protein
MSTFTPLPSSGGETWAGELEVKPLLPDEAAASADVVRGITVVNK